MENFKKEIEKRIKNFLPKEYINAEIEFKEVLKNNDTALTGLLIKEEDNLIVPTIYLESFKERLDNGESIDSVMDSIAYIYLDAINQTPVFGNAKEFIDSISNFDETKGKIIARIINRESNEESLKNIPHTDIGDDLAVTYHISLSSSENGSASIPITNSLAKQYGVDEGKLFEIANKNRGEINPTTFKSMNDVMKDIMMPKMLEECGDIDEAQDILDVMLPENPGMYVLSNEEKSFGAASLLDVETLDKVEKELGDFYILPSSVHEVLIIPKSTDMPLESLESMVQEVNRTQVAPSEVLSDHVYEYDKTSKKIKIAS